MNDVFFYTIFISMFKKNFSIYNEGVGSLDTDKDDTTVTDISRGPTEPRLFLSFSKNLYMSEHKKDRDSQVFYCKLSQLNLNL